MILTVTLNASIDKLYLVQSFAPRTVMRVQEVRNTAGGKGMNVSRVAAKLGEDVTAMGFVGGHMGQYFESLITQPSIRKAFTQVSAELRSCINCWDLSRGESTECLEPGAPVTQMEVERFTQDFIAALPAADVVTLSGSAPKGVPADFYAKLVRLSREAGKCILLDASGDFLRQAVLAKPDFVKPNTDEIAQWVGFCPQTPEEHLRAVRLMRQSGITVAALSMGSQGVLVASPEGVFHGIPPRLTPQNTVGCGDSMVAGFAVGMARGLDIAEQIRLAVGVSAASALSLGTGDYDEGDLQAILPQVEILQLASTES